MPLTTVSRQRDAARELGARFADVRGTTLRLTRHLSAEDQMLQSMPEASPTKWHLAHTTWFFETFVLQPHSRGYRAFDDRFKYLFNSYYKQLGSHPQRGSRGLMSRPALEEVHAYRDHVDRAISHLLETADEEVVRLIKLGLNHEQQHQELIVTDSKHALWSSPLPPLYQSAPLSSPEAVRATWIDHQGGTYCIGYAGDGFAFDNEGPRHEVLLRPFRLASRPVTNAEYLEFIADSGYRRPELWLSDGWDMACLQDWQAPLYWERRDDGSWWYFAADHMSPMDGAEPVCHLSYYEADAYARWRGARLPTEQEWEVAAAMAPVRGTFLEDEVFRPQATRAGGMQQVLGDVWEWTASPYVAYPGYRPAHGALGEYNGKFMCNQFVLRGGSCATPRSHIRVTYRNFFPPQARWQFSGIRLADDCA